MDLSIDKLADRAIALFELCVMPRRTPRQRTCTMCSVSCVTLLNLTPRWSISCSRLDVSRYSPKR